MKSVQVSHTPRNNPAFSIGVCVIGTGTVTSVGYSSSMTAASVRANISRFSESYMIDKAGEPMLLSLAEFIDHDLRGLDRLLALAVPAANEAMAPLLTDGIPPNRLCSVPVCLGIAASRPGFDSRIGHLMLSRLEAETAISFSKTQQLVIPTGHASGLMGIEKGVQLIRSGQEQFVLVGGVDSYYDPDTLEWLDENRRLHSLENKDGFVPGEGAGFLLLASAEWATRHGLTPSVYVLSIASGREPYPLASDGICIGRGLTTVLQQVLKVLIDADSKADWVICDMNGESFRATEWTYAYLRTGTSHRDPLEIWHPADCFGDIGAASSTVLVDLAWDALERNYGRGRYPLMWASSDQGERAAMALGHLPSRSA